MAGLKKYLVGFELKSAKQTHSDDTKMGGFVPSIQYHLVCIFWGG